MTKKEEFIRDYSRSNLLRFSTKDKVENAMSEAWDNALKYADGRTSDGYHTFDELYEYRKLYNAAFFNALAKDKSCPVIKSLKHSDGDPCFGGGWFIVMAQLPTGQISNHYEIKDWDMFKCEELEKAWEWDGHTPKDAADRLKEYILNY